MIVGSLGCKKATKSEEKEILDSLSHKADYYILDNKEYSSILEVYKFCKKNNITSGVITHQFGEWGNVKSLVTMKQKEVIEQYT